jgi:Flp pilus assembly CpaE family ATPase
VAAEVHAAVAELTAPSRIEPAITGQLPDPVVGTGKVVAVWGPAGAPGRSTIALNLAAELALADNPTLLVDADTYGGVLAQLVGVLDEAPGIAAACRLASAGGLDVARLAGVALEVRPALCLLSSITRADRWLELRPSALGVVLTLARTMAAYTVVDCGFCLEQEGEASYDTAAPRRNGATLAALAAADVVVAVAAADPVGLARYVRALPECLALTAAPVTIPVANRLRRRVIGPGDPRREVSAALERYAGITAVHCVPDDGEALDIALANGKTLLEAAPKSPARLAIKDLASVVAGDVTVQRGRRRR